MMTNNETSINNRKLWFLIIWFFVILFLITYPLQPPSMYDVVSYKDKVVHFILFGVFAYLILDLVEEFKKIRYYFFAFFVTIFYSGLTEYIQSYLPTRSASEMDFCAGVSGALIILPIVYAIKRKA